MPYALPPAHRQNGPAGASGRPKTGTKGVPPLAFAMLTAAFLVTGPVLAADVLTVTLRDHKFVPSEIEAPADTRLVIEVVNEDATPEEFESKSLKVEKIIPAKSKGVVRVGPLKPGRYDFFGEFNEATAKGVLVVK